MKKIVMLFMMAVIGLSAAAQTEQGRSSIGLNLGYGFSTENPIIGIDYRYSLTDAIRINPGLSHYIKKDGQKAWAIDLNAHYLVRLSDMFSFYPIVGVDLSFWDQELKKEPREDITVKENETATRFGGNIGLGLELYATERITAGVEFKYVIISKVDQAVLGLRVGYTF